MLSRESPGAFRSALPGGGAYIPGHFNLLALVSEPAPQSYEGQLLGLHETLTIIPEDAGVALPYLFGAPLADRAEIWTVNELKRRVLNDQPLSP